jgi:hypothetical protein
MIRILKRCLSARSVLGKGERITLGENQEQLFLFASFTQLQHFDRSSLQYAKHVSCSHFKSPRIRDFISNPPVSLVYFIKIVDVSVKRR